MVHRDKSHARRLWVVAGGLASALIVGSARAPIAEVSSQPPSQSSPLIGDLEELSGNSEFTRLLRAGEALAKSRDYRAAIEHYDRALAVGAPTAFAESSVLTYRAGALSRSGRMEDALRDHDRALALNPNAFVRWARAETLLKMQRYAEALEGFDAVLRLAPRDASAHVGRGQALWRLGKLEQARAAYDQAVAHKQDVHSLSSRGYFLAHQEDLAGAIADYSQALHIAPESVGPRINRANAYAQRGEFGKALEDYALALRTNENDAAIYRGRGWVYERQGVLELARADYERGLKLSPGDPWLRKALNNLSRRRQ
jgi:tetratricopeptide (TPR) repeat protein